MKKIILGLVLLVNFFGFGQETVLKDTDFIKSDTEVTSNSEMSVLNGEDKLVSVKLKFSCSLENYKLITIDKINSMISMSNKEAKHSLKNKSTYFPKVIRIIFLDENQWLIGFEYTAQNDYGATKEGISMSKFTKDGEFLETE